MLPYGNWRCVAVVGVYSRIVSVIKLLGNMHKDNLNAAAIIFHDPLMDQDSSEGDESDEPDGPQIHRRVGLNENLVE